MISLHDNRSYCLTLETVDSVDIFTKPMYKQIVVHSLNHFIDSKGLVVYGWTLLTNRLYLICQTQRIDLPLSALRTEFKQFTCAKIIDAINNEPGERRDWLLRHFMKSSSLFTVPKPKCWKPALSVVQLDINRPETMAEHLDMIHNLPVKDRIVQHSTDYLYSSARDYEGLAGLVHITMLTAIEQELHGIESRKSTFRSYYNK